MGLTAKNVRLECDSTSDVPMLDKLTGKRPILWRGGVAMVAGCIFNGTPGSGTLADISNVQTIELIVRKHNASGAVLLDILLPASELNPDCLYADWLAGTDQQFLFTITEQYTSWDVWDSGSLPIYLVVNVITDTTDYIAGVAYGQITETGIVDVVAADLPSSLLSLAPNAAGNTVVTPVRGSKNVNVVAQDTGTTYTYIVVLSHDAPTNSKINVALEIPATSNITIEVRDGSTTGTLLQSVTGDSNNQTNVQMSFIFDGNNWFQFGPAI